MNDDFTAADPTDATPELPPSPVPPLDPPTVPAWPVSEAFGSAVPPRSAESTGPAPARLEERRGGTSRAVAVGALVGALVGGGVGTGATLLLKDDSTKTVVVTSSSAPGQASRGTATVHTPSLTSRSDIHDLIANVEPAVVSITVEVTQSTPFGSQTGEASGTGFIISSDGTIVTNNHVVESAKTVEVHFEDGTNATAKVLGTDKYNDLGVIKVDKQDLPTLKLGSSADVRVGDDVVAIGNALALEGGLSVTRGIISGLKRSIQTDSDVRLSGLLQTDTAINPGNSGGPLLNAAGEVIGINTAIASPSESQNVGFAISIDAAKRIIAQLKNGNASEPGYLGVRSTDTRDGSGALVGSVEPNSPAAKAGLQSGDVIVDIDGNSVTSASDVVGLVKAHRAGDVITFEVDRDGKAVTLTATLARQPAT